MEDKKKTCKFWQIIFGIFLAVSVGLNVWLLVKDNKERIVEKVETTIVRDTIHDTIPQLVYQKVIKYRHDTLRVVETIPGDTVKVIAEVPVSQKEYSDDSTYRAWISGYKAKLDSINVYNKTVIIETDLVKNKKQRFIVGPHVGYGFDFQRQKGAPTVGIGITYKLFGF